MAPPLKHRVGAHILVFLLAYALWKTLAASRHQAGLGDEPRQVFEELSEITLVDVVLPTRNGVELHKRCISQPTERQRILLQRLGISLACGAKCSGNLLRNKFPFTGVHLQVVRSFPA